MAFDCLAIGVGLLASVMAKWPPNERFTFGQVLLPFQCGENILRFVLGTAESKHYPVLQMEYSLS